MLNNKSKDNSLPAKGVRVTIETADPEYLAKGMQPKTVYEGKGSIVYTELQGAVRLDTLGNVSISKCIHTITRCHDVELFELIATWIAAQRAKQRDEGAAQDAEAEARVREAEQP